MDFSQRQKFWISTGALLLALMGTFFYLRYREEGLLAIAGPRQVLRVQQAVPAGTVLTAEMLEVAEVPARYLEPSAIQRMEEGVGKWTAVPLQQGEQLLASKLIGEGGGGMDRLLPEGMRAVTILLDPHGSMGPVLHPQQRVDILASFDWKGDGSAQPVTVTVAQNIPILAVDGEIRPTAWKGKSVTVGLAPQQAQEVTFAEELGVLRLALRPFGSEELAPLQPTRSENLSGIAGFNFQKEYLEYRGRPIR